MCVRALSSSGSGQGCQFGRTFGMSGCLFAKAKASVVDFARSGGRAGRALGQRCRKSCSRADLERSGYKQKKGTQKSHPTKSANKAQRHCRNPAKKKKKVTKSAQSAVHRRDETAKRTASSKAKKTVVRGRAPRFQVPVPGSPARQGNASPAQHQHRSWAQPTTQGRQPTQPTQPGTASLSLLPVDKPPPPPPPLSVPCQWGSTSSSATATTGRFQKQWGAGATDERFY